MSEPELVQEEPRPDDAPASGFVGVPSSYDTTDELPLLTRLNAHGFRLVQLADILALALITVGTMVVREGWDWPTYPMSLYAVSFFIIVAIFVAALYFGGLYEREPRLGYPPALPRAARQTLAAGGIVALLNLVATGLAQELGYSTARALPMPIPNLIVLIVLGAVAVAGNRRLTHLVRYRNEGPPKVLLVGAPDDVNTAKTHLRTDPARAEVVGEVSEPHDLLNLVEEYEVTDVVLLSSKWLDSLYPDVLMVLEHRGITVLQRVTAKETMFGLERVRQIGGMPFVLLRSHTMAVSRERFKRFTDLIFLLLMAPIALPVVALLVLYQLIVAGRPIFYFQERVGAGGSTFRMVKFRTMYPEAESDGRARLAEKDDPRVIPACRWMRSTRADEIPQLWNVFKGEMSLVGPRPERPELTRQFEQLIPGYARRHEIPPGLTGLAQIHGRYHTDPEYKLGYDLQYLVNWSPVLDLEILLRTVWVVVTRRI